MPSLTTDFSVSPYMVHQRIFDFTPPVSLIHILFFLLLSMNDSIIIIKQIWVNVDSNVVEMSGQPPKDLRGRSGGGGTIQSMCTWRILLYCPPPSLLGGQIHFDYIPPPKTFEDTLLCDPRKLHE